MAVIKPMAAPAWRDAPGGVRVLIRTGPTEALSAARRASRAAVTEDPAADPYLHFVLGACLWATQDWAGVEQLVASPDASGDEAVQPAPFSRDLLSDLLRQDPDLYDWYEAEVVGPLLGLLSEKNGSRPSANGTSPTEGPNTAPTAPSPAPTPVPTGSTPPPPTPDSASGS
jgi:hypothetical protein